MLTHLSSDTRDGAELRQKRWDLEYAKSTSPEKEMKWRID